MRGLVALALLGGCATRLLDTDGGARSCGTIDLDPSQLVGASTSPSALHATTLVVKSGTSGQGFTATTVDGAADTRSFHLALHGTPMAMDYRFDIDVTADDSASLDYKDGNQRWLSLDGMLHLVPAGTSSMITLSNLTMRADPSTPAQGRMRIDGNGTFDISCAQ